MQFEGSQFYSLSKAIYIFPLFFSSEYLATFKKTVAMHEVFLQRLAAHPALRTDINYRIFLEYDQDVSVVRKEETGNIMVLLLKISNRTRDFVMYSAYVFGEFTSIFVLLTAQCTRQEQKGENQRLLQDRDAIG